MKRLIAVIAILLPLFVSAQLRYTKFDSTKTQVKMDLDSLCQNNPFLGERYILGGIFPEEQMKLFLQRCKPEYAKRILRKMPDTFFERYPELIELTSATQKKRLEAHQSSDEFYHGECKVPTAKKIVRK